MRRNKPFAITPIRNPFAASVLTLLLCATLIETAVAARIELAPVRDIWTTSVFTARPGFPASGPGGGRNDEALQVGGWGDEYRSLLQFDLSGISQPVTSATLELFHLGHPDPRYSPVGMHLDRVTSEWDWTDNPLDSGTLDQDRLWWDDRPSYVPTLSFLAAPLEMTLYSIDISDIVNGQLASTYDNYGVQLRPISNNQDFNYFASADHANEAWRPRLILETQNEAEPVPSPSPFALWALGALVLMMQRRKNKRHPAG